MNISIKEPCHENWEAMTPNQQGAFCKVCSKDVIDFSNKSIEHIKDFFSRKKEEGICGRFGKKQLAYINFDDFFSSFRYWNFAKKFAVIFFFTFGFAFTTCAQEEPHMKGKVAMPKEQRMLQGEPAVVPEKYIKGDVAPGDTTRKKPVKPKETKGNVKCEKANEPQIMGLMAVPPKQKKTQKQPPKKEN